jgi:cytochrome c553
MKYIILIMSLLSLASCSEQKSNAKVVTTEKAKVCASCHDHSVRTSSVEAPSLTGRTYEELVAAIEDVHEYHVSQPSLMHDFKTEDIHGIATYFANAE